MAYAYSEWLRFYLMCFQLQLIASIEPESILIYKGPAAHTVEGRRCCVSFRADPILLSPIRYICDDNMLLSKL